MITVVLHVLAAYVMVVIAANVALLVVYVPSYLRTRLPARDGKTRPVSVRRRTAPGARR